MKSQLALKDNVAITGETSFLELGADSLDTVSVAKLSFDAFGFQFCNLYIFDWWTARLCLWYVP